MAVPGQELLQQEAQKVITGMENQYPGKAIGGVIILVRIDESDGSVFDIRSSNNDALRVLRHLMLEIARREEQEE
jgi:hypothetical protein